MKKMDKFFEELMQDEELKDEFIDSFTKGTLLTFFSSRGIDPKLSEFSELLEKIKEYDKNYLTDIVHSAEEDPSLDIPTEAWNDMAMLFEGDDEIYPPDYLINYNKKFRRSRPILFRDEIVRQTLSCLICKFKPNVLLIGPAGVGKTRIAEDIARMLAKNDKMIPQQLKGFTVWELPLSALAAGSSLVGEVESKTRAMIDFATSRSNKVILFIDEVHLLVSGEKPYYTISQILKPALARGSLRVIGATTSQEVIDFDTDPAFKRRFNKIIVDELTKEQTQKILCSLRMALYKHYNSRISLTNNVMTEAVVAADEYRISGSHRPDNAITLLDRSIADAVISTPDETNDPIVITPEHITHTAVKLSTGKIFRINYDKDSLRKKLEVIKGQDDVLDTIIDIIMRDSLDLFPRTKPLTFLLAGSSGTGKTETARIIAQELTGCPPIILNMTEFAERSSLSRIIGVHAGYAGCDSRAELPFDIIESNPRQVILLDEFEKCHRVVKRLFMGVFDNGYIQLANNKIIDFSRAIIIATTNAGCDAVHDKIGFNNDDSTEPSIKDLSSGFDAALLNRFSKILYYHPISEQLYRDILRDKYVRMVREIKQNRKIGKMLPDALPDDVVDRITAESYIPLFGARPIERLLKQHVENTILNTLNNNTKIENRQ